MLMDEEEVLLKAGERSRATRHKPRLVQPWHEGLLDRLYPQ